MLVPMAMSRAHKSRQACCRPPHAQACEHGGLSAHSMRVLQCNAQEHVAVVTNGGRGGRLPSVPDRGSALNGSSYAALAPDQAAVDGMGLRSGACPLLHRVAQKALFACTVRAVRRSPFYSFTTKHP